MTVSSRFRDGANPPTSADPRRQNLERVDEILELTYRSKDLGNHRDPLDEVIYIILSRQTHEAVYQRTFQDLKRRWPSWSSVLRAGHEEVEHAVAAAGFGATRAAQIIELLKVVRSTCRARGHTGLHLDWLRQLPDRDAQDILLSLPGVGPKTARCVLHYSLGRPAFAVDTHIRRILDRLGIVPDPGGKIDHVAYEAAIPAAMRHRLHVNLIHHGRTVCRRSNPRCSRCPLVSFCSAGRSQTRHSERPTVIELFGGAGGMATGFELAGYQVAVAVEANREAAQTYRVNHPGTIVIEADVATVTGSHLLALAPRVAGAEAIIAGPPCQGYSAAGKRRASDSKNTLFQHVIRLARQLKPRFVIIENVPGMRRVEGTSFTESVLHQLAAAGFSGQEALLRACDFGVPQLRHRLLFLAQRRRTGPAPHAPQPTHCARAACVACIEAPGKCGLPETPTVLDKLADLPKLAPGTEAEYSTIDGKLLLNASTMAHSEHVIAKISTITPGTGPISYRRLSKELAHTVIAGHRALPVHPELHRTISVREAARIQGFDDNYVFAGPRWLQPLQVANAVPPPLAYAIASSLRALAIMT